MKSKEELRRWAQAHVLEEGYDPPAATLVDDNIESLECVWSECDYCGREFLFLLDEDRYNRWLHREMLIQDAMPGIPPGYREILKSHICPECWDQMFGRR